MAMDRRRFVMTSTGWALAGPGAISALAGGQTGASNTKPYGSGHFGEWVQDEFGLRRFITPATRLPIRWRSAR